MINIALIGLGRIGQMHGQNLLLHNDFKLKYVFDLDKNLTNKIAKKFLSIGINDPKVAFRDKEIDAIFIACLLYTSPSPRDKRQSRMAW